MNSSKTLFAFLSFLTTLTFPFLWPAKSVAFLSYIASEGTYRFETQEAFDQFYTVGCFSPDSGCQAIADNGGQVFTTDHRVGLAIYVDGAQDGENIVWRFVSPDGSLQWASGITYDYETDCWTGALTTCGDPNRPYLDSRMRFINSTLINCEVTGVWTVEIWNNGIFRFSEQFRLVQSQNGPLVILSPIDQQDFDLGPQNVTATEPISFAAQVAPPTTVNWEMDLSYKPSRKESQTFTTATRTFTTQSGETHEETFQSEGGLLKITAEAVVAGQLVRDCITATITGARVPEADITTRLVELYSRGATPRLMTGIAAKESNYLHFCIPQKNCTTGQGLIYNRQDYWPHESLDNTASHIGLMQVPITLESAWNWLKNSETAVDLFAGDKLRFARTNERYIRHGVPKQKIPGHVGLRALTDVELESMALVLYGPFAPGTQNVPAPTLAEKLAKQYYTPECLFGIVVQKNHDLECQGGLWTWMPNLVGNFGGVDYANNVRAYMK